MGNRSLATIMFTDIVGYTEMIVCLSENIFIFISEFIILYAFNKTN